MISDEFQIKAAYVMRDAADKIESSSYRIEEAVRQLKFIFEDGYGSNAVALLEELKNLREKP